MAFEPVKETGGALYVVATPIGNLDDLTFRAVKCLKEVDLIACEDTRRTAKLLNHLGIRKPLISCFEHNELARVDELLGKVASGLSVALVSDAGTPTISDPGFALVRAAQERGLKVIPVPGPSALIAALSVSGLPTDEFLFAGFLPRTGSARRARLLELREQRGTLIFYEAPHRMLESLADMRAVLGDREAFLSREITKVHEELRRAPLSALETELGGRPEVLGEIVLVVAGAPAAVAKSGSMDEALARFATEVAMGATPRQAAKEAAQATGLEAREVYARAAALKPDRSAKG
jgi:16S rRNA (cytidine1402-2'-O)-methyltransferase